MSGAIAAPAYVVGLGPDTGALLHGPVEPGGLLPKPTSLLGAGAVVLERRTTTPERVLAR